MWENLLVISIDKLYGFYLEVQDLMSTNPLRVNRRREKTKQAGEKLKLTREEATSSQTQVLSISSPGTIIMTRKTTVTSWGLKIVKASLKNPLNHHEIEWQHFFFHSGTLILSMQRHTAGRTELSAFCGLNLWHILRWNSWNSSHILQMKSTQTSLHHLDLMQYIFSKS